MMRFVIVAAATASGASAALWGDGDMAKNFQDANERRHNLAAQHHKGNERREARTDEEGASSRTVRQLKRHREDEQTHGMLVGLQMGAAHHRPSNGGRAPKTGKGPPAKAPSNGGGFGKKSSKHSPSSPTPGRSKTDKGGGGKSRKVASGICDKRLTIAYGKTKPLSGPDSPFGIIDSPADVTDLCYFVPPEKPTENNLGCPFFYIPNNDEIMGPGFLTTEEEYVEVVGNETGKAVWSVVLYCQCYQGFDLGCAAKIPHGPPTSMAMYSTADGDPKEVLVNGYSEFIPFSTPEDRAEYCKMVGVWNGDFDADVADEFTSEVMDCGCYFVGQAKDMVSQCPGVDLGAFFKVPEEGGPSRAPTPEGVVLVDDFETATFPKDPWWTVENDDFEAPSPDANEPAAILQNEFDTSSKWGLHGNRRLGEGDRVDLTMLLKASQRKGHRNDKARRTLQRDAGEKSGREGRRLDEHDGMNWALTTNTPFGDYAIKSPDLSNADETPKYASAILNIRALEDEGMLQTPGWLQFAYKTDFSHPDSFVDVLAVLVDGEFDIRRATRDKFDWTTYFLWVPEGTKEVAIQYIYNFYEFSDLPGGSGTAYVDEVYFDSLGTQFPTSFPTSSPIPGDEDGADNINTPGPTPTREADDTPWPTAPPRSD